MSNIREIEHTIKLVAKLDVDKMPLEIAYMIMQVDEKQLNKILAQTFVASMNHIGALDKMNEGNAYATIEFGDN